MFSFIAIGGLMKRNASSIQAIIASALVLLAIRPNMLFEVGFQLSYAAVFGIIYLQPKIYRLIPPIKNKLLDSAWQITAVSIAAQAATFPLSVYYFHQFPLLFVFSNLFVIPLAFATMGYGLFVLLVSAVAGVFNWLVLPLKGLLWLMVSGVSLIEEIPYAVITKLWIGRVEIILYLVLVFTLAEVFWHYRKWSLFVATACAISILTISSLRSIERNNQNELILYSIKRQNAIEVRQGRKSVLLASQDLLKNEDAMLFHIRHNLWAGGIRNLTELPVDSNLKSEFVLKQDKIIDTRGIRLLLLNEPSDTNCFNLKPDYILLSGNIKPPKKIPDVSTVIFQPGISKRTKTQWQKLTNAIHDLAANDALIINL
jgi:competence protein ComEC